MTTHHYAAPLLIEPRPSRRLLAALLAFHAVALLSVGWVAISWLVKAALMPLLALGLAHAWQNHFGAGRIVSLLWDEEGRWEAARADGRRAELRLEEESYLSGSVVVLNFRAGKEPLSLVLLPDSLDPESFRRLRVRLRLEGTKAPGSEKKEDSSAGFVG